MKFLKWFTFGEKRERAMSKTSHDCPFVTRHRLHYSNFLHEQTTVFVLFLSSRLSSGRDDEPNERRSLNVLDFTWFRLSNTRSHFGQSTNTWMQFDVRVISFQLFNFGWPIQQRASKHKRTNARARSYAFLWLIVKEHTNCLNNSSKRWANKTVEITFESS